MIYQLKGPEGLIDAFVFSLRLWMVHRECLDTLASLVLRPIESFDIKNKNLIPALIYGRLNANSLCRL
jgi:hypothetical protein